MLKFILVALLCGALAISTAVAGPVNVNKADAQTISNELKGIGLAKAKAIVEYRQKHGPFKRPEDLSLVKGIGEKTLKSIKSDVLVSDSGAK